jgi:hypothetical protein
MHAPSGKVVSMLFHRDKVGGTEYHYWCVCGVSEFMDEDCSCEVCQRFDHQNPRCPNCGAKLCGDVISLDTIQSDWKFRISWQLQVLRDEHHYTHHPKPKWMEEVYWEVARLFYGELVDVNFRVAAEKKLRAELGLAI